MRTRLKQAYPTDLENDAQAQKSATSLCYLDVHLEEYVVLAPILKPLSGELATERSWREEG